VIVAKQVADVITGMRALIALFLIWLGESQGAAGLHLAIWAMLADWIGDAVDGPIARRSRVVYQSWIGDHDLEVDMTVSVGLLAYLLLSGYLSVWVGAVYIMLWGLGFWRHGGVPRSYGMLFQTPIYAWFLYVALRDAPGTGWVLPAFIVIIIVLTWPRFPQMVIPGFLNGLRKQDHNSETG
jgi:hypothetical protein